jgi:peroxiredoxin Q/BCP
MASTKNSKSPYPAAGAAAPKFTAEASDGSKVKLADYKGKVVVLYFYPRDDTSGCTKEACGFRDSHKKLTDAGIVVLGVSPDSVASHEKFISKYKLPFLLLSDPDKKICEMFGVWQQKSMYGRKYMGVARTTFVIDSMGRIAHVFEKVKPADHDAQVLAWIKSNLS